MLRNAKGMTLLEIMIVLAILGGLIGILGNQVVKRLQSAKIKETKIQIAELSKALDMFYTDCGFYPSSEAGLEALVSEASGCNNWGPDPYIPKVKKDPFNCDFIYEREGSSYIIISLGEGCREGGKGTEADISSDNL